MSVSQHALGRWLRASPSQHALYHKGLFFFLSFFSFVFLCFVSLLFTPQRTWIQSVSVVLYVCSLVAFLWYSFHFDRIPQPASARRRCVWATPGERGRATSTFPTPSPTYPLSPLCCPHTPQSGVEIETFMF